MSSGASEVGFRDYLSHNKSVKSYTRRTNIIFRRPERNVSHSFLQTYFGPFTKQWYIVIIPIFPYSFSILNSL